LPRLSSSATLPVSSLKGNQSPKGTRFFGDAVFVGKTSCKKFSPHPFQELSQHFLCVKVFIFSVRLRYTADSCRGATTLKNLAKSNIFHENVWMLLSNHAGSGTPHPSPAVTPVSLRLGHARVLTAHRAVIHCPRAASLPRGGRLLLSFRFVK